MRGILERRRIVLEPQDVLDEAYIEDVLGLKENGEYLLLKRENSATELSFPLITEESKEDSW